MKATKEKKKKRVGKYKVRGFSFSSFFLGTVVVGEGEDGEEGEEGGDDDALYIWRH